LALVFLKGSHELLIQYFCTFFSSFNLILIFIGLNNAKSMHNLKPKLKTTLASSGLLLAELTVLVSNSGRDSTYDHLRNKVVDDNVLLKPSIQSCQVIWGKLLARYRFDIQDDLFQIWWNLIPQTENYDLAQLATLRWAQYDLILRFLWNEIYLVRRNMEPSVQSENIIAFIKELKGAHLGKRFFLDRSENVQVRMAQHFLLLLRDCGAAKGKKIKKFVTPPIGKNASCYAVHLAKREFPGSHEILEHWALKWWGGNSSKANEILNRTRINEDLHRS